MFYLLSYLIGYTNLSQQIPDDKTGDFDKISDFLEKNWKIARWVALGAIILQVGQSSDVEYNLASIDQRNYFSVLF